MLVSADDFRDLVSEFDHASVASLEFYRWSPPEFRYGDPVPNTGGYAVFTIGGPYAFVPNAPYEYIERLSEGDRNRAPALVWQWAELSDGTPTESLRTIDQVGHDKADRFLDTDLGKWYECATCYDFRRQAKVSGVVGLLLDVDGATEMAPIPPEDP